VVSAPFRRKLSGEAVTDASAYIGIGSNLGERMVLIRRALDRLAVLSHEQLRMSAVYEARALGPAQPRYLNAVVHLKTDLDPLPLLCELQRIELDLGRVRVERWGPRTIDLDLLLVFRGGAPLTIVLPGLTVPHPEIVNRDFVLAPLCDLEPDPAVAPGVTAASSLAALMASQRTIRNRYAFPALS
jgi:2-amino-4-hydroxy-6-hydroxymethyldihydropteridine diphosphokinase